MTGTYCISKSRYYNDTIIRYYISVIMCYNDKFIRYYDIL
jgi:hypothetical protein